MVPTKKKEKKGKSTRKCPFSLLVVGERRKREGDFSLARKGGKGSRKGKGIF